MKLDEKFDLEKVLTIKVYYYTPINREPSPLCASREIAEKLSEAQLAAYRSNDNVVSVDGVKYQFWYGIHLLPEIESTFIPLEQAEQVATTLREALDLTANEITL